MLVFITTNSDIGPMDKNDPYIATRADLLAALLPEVAFYGWTQKALDAALAKSKQDADMVLLAFPKGIDDMLAYYSADGDQKMLAALPDIKNAAKDMKIRDRISHAVFLRCQIDAPHREAACRAAAYLSAPLFASGRQKLAAKLLFDTANHIWHWAGDDATDYNYYSKRLILSGVLASTRLVWLRDDSSDFSTSRAFLNRRIEDVMRFEKLKSRWREKTKKGRAKKTGKGESAFEKILKNLADTRYRDTG